MTTHQHVHAHPHEHPHLMPENPDSQGDDAGIGFERWVLRSMLLAIVGLAVTAVVASLDDIKRYMAIRRM